MLAALTQVLGALWAFILGMVACLTGRCAHSPFKAELPVVAPYGGRVNQTNPKAAGGITASTHTYGATSVEARMNNGLRAFFDDSGEGLDVKELGTRNDDIEAMKSEWSKLLKQGSGPNSSDEDGASFTPLILRAMLMMIYPDDLYFFSSLTTKKPSPEPGQFHDAALSLCQVEPALEDIDLVDISCPSSPSTTESAATDSPLPTSSSYEAFEKFQVFRFPVGPASPDCASPMFSPGPWYEEFEQTGAASRSGFFPTTPMTISIGKRGIVLHDYGDFDKNTLSTPAPFRRGYQWSRDVV
ncbi:hypothetical protein PLEOSDRAFT_1102903 [Pleurotus ostreatus PC15]|uniref:Uncharacterized protein n=1 Tax=Pleurotus ostreatus (strain PC15) TaxID=1137138 RepID=A0A067NLB9_PLEO1|nr:hypothetical protein PLEOSDRAFT_1102903 [Pleurotus ostreatus PC15]